MCSFIKTFSVSIAHYLENFSFICVVFLSKAHKPFINVHNMSSVKIEFTNTVRSSKVRMITNPDSKCLASLCVGSLQNPVFWYFVKLVVTQFCEINLPCGWNLLFLLDGIFAFVVQLLPVWELCSESASSLWNDRISFTYGARVLHWVHRACGTLALAVVSSVTVHRIEPHKLLKVLLNRIPKNKMFLVLWQCFQTKVANCASGTAAFSHSLSQRQLLVIAFWESLQVWLCASTKPCARVDPIFFISVAGCFTAFLAPRTWFQGYTLALSWIRR